MRRNVVRRFAMTLIMAPMAIAGTLRVGVPEVNGGTVVLPVLLEGDVSTGVAALDFTLEYDPAVFQPAGAAAGAAAASAHKQVQSNEVSPGNYVVMMFGMNQSTVQNGQVAAITLTTKSQPDSNQSGVAIKKTTLASVDGLEIASEGSNQTVTFAPAPGNPDDGNPPPDDGNTPPPTDGNPGTPQAPTPDPPTTPPPGEPTDSPGGAPVPVAPAPAGEGDPPGTDAPQRPSSMPISASGSNSAAPLADTANRLARLNAATQRLEQSRAGIAAAEVSTEQSGDAPAGSERDSAKAAQLPDAPAMSASPGQITPITLPSTAIATDSTLAKQYGGDPSDAKSKGEVIPESSKRGLKVVVLVVAVSLLVLRLSGNAKRAPRGRGRIQ